MDRNTQVSMCKWLCVCVCVHECFRGSWEWHPLMSFSCPLTKKKCEIKNGWEMAAFGFSYFHFRHAHTLTHTLTRTHPQPRSFGSQYWPWQDIILKGLCDFSAQSSVKAHSSKSLLTATDLWGVIIPNPNVFRCEVMYFKQKSWQLRTDSIKFMAALNRV